ncbi:acyltransferase family protein [Streptomyces sp. NPDC056069]|uniref:acyltransferase family protein n=1 Tax=Streptomyces sp. NPDC056069 TaxID=3345702 RepID=UPI0035D66190
MPALPTQTVGTSESAAPGRAAYFDNAKLLAVVLVVCGHFWEPLIGQPEQRHVKALYLLVYAFHMPAFVFISGYFTRTYTARPRQVRRLATGVLVPFVLWGVLLALFNSFLTGAHPKILPLTPVWITWFLIALFVWRLSAPLWRNLRAPVTTTTAVFLAAGAFSLGAQLSITRVLQFLPFFVLGLTVSSERLAWLRDRAWARPAALAAFVTAGAGAYVLAPDISAVWFYRSAGASELHVSYVHWLVQASAVYAVGLVLTGAFLVLVPGRRTWFTALGAGTMSAFLLHAFVRQAALHGGLYDHEFFQGVPGQAVLTVLSAGLALALCTRPVHRLMRPLIEPRLRWLFRSDEVARHRAVSSPGTNT